MARMKILSALSNRILAGIKQNRVLLVSVSNRILLGISQNRVIISAATLGRYIIAVLKDFFESIGVADAISKILGKGVNDQVGANEQINKSLSTTKLDQFSANDLAIIQSGKVVQDVGYLSDVNVKVVGKQSADIANATDTRSFNIYKQIENTIFVTDDIGGEASIDDEQNIAFFKILSELNIATDTISFETAYNRSFADSSQALDSISLAVNYVREFSDSVAASDLVVANIILTVEIFDSALLNDNLSFVSQYLRDYANQVSTTDSAVLRASPSNDDQGLTTDILERQVGYQRVFSDTVLVTDDIGAETSIDDDQTIQFLKQVSNLATVVENSVIFAGKVVGDILNTTDSGSLLNQDYVDNPNYFAEDYVGVKRIF